ncbi:hypothetical protein L3C95_16690 [Chitinophaga filiformis]|uniref:hypothetical protein n=1 Tax=Chitinophaga filiformis TaxID=104663 RepID=UPI001F25473D|nr:hypothetical protein [Chitinophaga filiformis]MCF6404536.1 hypothetical protein [Chitinophaga filiformis]
MKSLSVKALALLITTAAVFTACKKQSAEEKLKLNGNTAVALAPSKDAQLLADLFKKEAPKTQFFTIQSRENSTIKTQHGNTYIIPAGAFRRKDGSVPTGLVTVAIREVLTPKDFVLADKPTANDGDYLVSYGEYFVRATEAGADLTLATPITVRVVPPGEYRPQGGVPMWDGDTSVLVTFDGYDYRNQPIRVAQAVSENPGVNWSQTPDYALFNSSTGTLDFQLTDLLTWSNCDAFNTVTGPRTTVLGYFNVFNDDTPGSSPEQPSMLFFKPRNINSVIKFSNLILDAPDGFKGFLSYQNVVPVGQEGTFLAITALNGQFYAELKDVVIDAPAAGTNYSPVTFDLQPVSGSDLLALIAELNNR